MARYRLSGPALADVAAILASSEAHHGKEARIRYRACLTAAMRRVATNPEGHSTVDHSELLSGTRSFHIRHSHNESRAAPVANPVHVLFYRGIEPGLVEIMRVLHERMEAGRHLGSQHENEN